MKKQKHSILVSMTLLFTGFTLGFFLGKNQPAGDVILSVPASAVIQDQETQADIENTVSAQTLPPPETKPPITFPININTAGKEELMALPGIGEVLAGRILQYREEHGPFYYAEELMNVEGIGEKRIEAIWDLISTGG